MIDYNNILTLPLRCIVDKKLTKAFFQKNYVLTASEKKLLTEKIEGMQWLGMISPTNANIPAVKTPEYDFSLINIFVIALHGTSINPDGTKAIQLLQKYLPDQALIVVENEFEFIINTCDKRINQVDKSKRTIERYYTTEPIAKLYKKANEQAFFEALAFHTLDKTNLQTSYTSYSNAIVQLKAAEVTGTFKTRSKVRSAEDLVLMTQIEDKDEEIASLRSQLKRETQLNAQVKLNLAIQGLKTEIEEIKNLLSKE